MSEYKGIKGFQVQTRTEDPTNGIDGDFYYNSTTGQFKTVNDGGAPIGTWSSGGNMNTGRYRLMGGAGSVPAGLIVGGYAPSAPAASNAVEQYDGSSWTSAPNYPSSETDIATTGGYNAALSAGGGPSSPALSTATNHWNGSSWTAGGALPAGRSRMPLLGISTAALGVGGAGPPGETYVNKTLEYNGSSWSEGGDLDTVLANGGCSGTQTAGFSFGGYTPSNSNQAQQYNGTAWTETTSLNSPRGESMFSVHGTQSSSIISQGGSPYSQAVNEAWNGTAWTEIADVSNGRSSGGSVGTASAMFDAGGILPTSPPTLTATEEFSADDFQIKTVTTS